MGAIEKCILISKANAYAKILLLMIWLLALVSCSDQGAEQECPITIDSVTIVDSLKQAHVTYYLVHRISGWSDKTEILELYDRKPTFDHCSRSNIEPIYGDSLEIEQSIAHVYLNTKDRLLEFEYKKGEPESSSQSGFKLELRQGVEN